jgi:hypothetical protein
MIRWARLRRTGILGSSMARCRGEIETCDVLIAASPPWASTLYACR